MQFFLTATLALAALTAASPLQNRHVVHEKREITSSQWTKRSRVPADAVMPMRIGLTQRNLHTLENRLYEVSDPNSPNYAKHYTPHEVVEMFKPHDDTVIAVKEWLASSGIPRESISLTNDKGWLSFKTTASKAEDIFQTEYHRYEHERTGATATACEEYRLPHHIQEHVDYVSPGIKLLAPRKPRRDLIESRSSSIKLANGEQPEKRSFHRSDTKKFHEVPVLEKVAKGNLDTCDVAITPQCVQALYKFPNGTKADPSNAMGIFEDLGDVYAQEDLNLFYANFTPYIPKGFGPTLKGIDGGKAPIAVGQAGGESDLDFELAIPILYPQKTIVFQTDDMFYENNYEFGGFFNTFLDALDRSYCNFTAFNETGNDPTLDPIYPDPNKGGFKGKLQCGKYTPTNVISISYGGQEADTPPYYQQRQCLEWGKLGMLGVSVFVASGDDGVGGPTGDDSNNGCLGDGKVFSPAFPNSCPYITNVGATKVYPGHKVTDPQPESAANDPAGHPYRSAYSSGGGFSNIYPVPSYQQAAVAAYFSASDPGYPSYPGPGNASFGANGGIYNRNGRGYPDVAANGDNIATYNEGAFGLSGGTSAATPIFASIINRVNEERIAAGKKPVGFVNPVLYSNPGALNDIVNGSNPNCGTNGFSAVKGWDPVTGLGTPNFPKLLSVFMALP